MAPWPARLSVRRTAHGFEVGGRTGTARGTVPAEPGLRVLAGAREGQVRPQHLLPQTHWAAGEQVALPRRSGLHRPLSERLRTKSKPPIVPGTTSYSARQHPNPAILSLAKPQPSTRSGRNAPAVPTATRAGGRLSANSASHDLGSAPFTLSPGFSLSPPRFPSLLNNRKLSWAECQWPRRLRARTGSGAMAWPKGPRRCRPQQPARTPGPGGPPPRVRGARLACPWGGAGSCPQPQPPLTWFPGWSPRG